MNALTDCTMNRDGNLLRLLVLVVALTSYSKLATAGDRMFVPVRWCGIEGAPSMEDPGVVNEATTDNVLWRRHERPTDGIYHDVVDLTFRAGATAAIKDGPQSFPIIRDPQGSGGDVFSEFEANDAVIMCRRVWQMGDPLYFDENNNNTIDDGIDSLLSASFAIIGSIDLGHDGAVLKATPTGIGFVDADADDSFDIGERIYRDENSNGIVDLSDTLLVNTSETLVGSIDAADLALPFLAVPANVKYLDLIRQPPDTFNIGYPLVQGVTGVSVNDLNIPTIAFPVHGIAVPGIGGRGAVMDDPSQYLPPGPDYTLFETQLVGHEFGHSLGLRHGDGIDDDMDGQLDEPDDPTAPVPGAGPGTKCENNNVMSYCWLDNGSPGAPDLEFIGIDGETFGQFTTAQAEVIRDVVLSSVPDVIIDPVTLPLVSSRADAIGEIERPFEYLDIAEYSVEVDVDRENALLTIQTRRPIPSDADAINLHFLIDVDGDRKTGASKAALDELGIPSDFAGGDFVGTAQIRGPKIEATKIFQFDPRTGSFVQVGAGKIRGTIETLNAIPDFPFGLKDKQEFPVSSLIEVLAPLSLVTVPINATFGIEIILQDPQNGVIDRARSGGMTFDVPVFPECHVDPEIVQAGENTTVVATGLLPGRSVHLLLGADEIAQGRSDDTGRVTITMIVPKDAKTGQRLVTVGALAVSADCSVTIQEPKATAPQCRCCGTGSLLTLALLMPMFWMRHVNRSHQHRSRTWSI